MDKKIWIGAGLFVLLIIWSCISLYPDWLWFENLEFSPIFWTMLLSKFGFGVLVWLLLIIALSVNVYAAKRYNTSDATKSPFGEAGNYLAQFGLSSNAINLLLVAFLLIVSFVIASKGSKEWDMVLRYLYQQPFGTTDPIFGKDIGFYVFSLPLYLFVRTGLMVIVLFAGIITLLWYLKEGAVQVEGEFTPEVGAPNALPKITIAENAKKHVMFLAGIMLLLYAWGHYLKIYGLLYSTQGPAFGASYTDINVKVWAFKILIVASVAMSIILFVNVFNYRKKFMWMSAGAWVVVMLLLGTGLPVLVQKFIVKPNELEKESEYIKYNIDYTRKAYNLNKIKVVNFSIDEKLTVEDLKKNDVTIQNIRVWDERPLLQTYRQIQSIRLYYDFNNVDVDRYQIGERYRQIMLAARELVVDQLPPQANTWVNRHLTYTHGYGLAASPVNEVTPEGLPQLLVKDLPPSYVPDLKVDRPEVYYGEKTAQYVLVKTKTKEFDFPKGDKNVYTEYEGEGGVQIKSFLRRLLFAIEFLDPQILFTTHLGPESRIMYKRRIDIRSASLAPFLDYDNDPYLVVSEGRLIWVLDAYTTSNMYPYSSPSFLRFKGKGMNYIRNSVKVTIDAYSGKVRYYLMDDTDPIVMTYKKIFPDLFKPFKEMPADLKNHIRYPKDLFEIQADTYKKYHMEEAQVFYNQEDLWQIPDELYGDSRQEMKSYYIIMKLPQEEKAEFLLMLPFTPSKKDNMIGWLAAKNDLPGYGNLLVYKLPKEKLVYGPMQIEARVDQQTEISRELTLWGQRGSRVIRGNLLAIPVSNSFIYVEPVYLEAKQGEDEPAAPPPPQSGGLFKSKKTQPLSAKRRVKPRTAALPELKRVIVAHSNRIVMEESLEAALSKIFGEIETTVTQISPRKAGEISGVHELGGLALQHYNNAKTYLKQGNWAGYGRELESLEKILEEISGMKK